ncbi:glycosyl transferase [Tetrasphaera phage TJE1]|uniref:Glycosyl transferase n=1 Tax=Tetrasphaera phage TJE1 TaxID=981335 RepID=G4W946_9CAUD|nr:glycosyltransferase [Tetrasphaera phage TJE1]ADX42534.1 glycosyl transferase [Tetrasphaera phage TJE1]
MEDTKKRILWYSDTPTCATGFGNVAKNLLKELFKPGEQHLTVLGINYNGEPYDHEEFPYLKADRTNPLDGLWPANHNGDMYGLQKFLEFIRRGAFDVVYVLQDPFILKMVMPALQKLKDELPKKFKLVFYFPIDCTPKKDWVDECIALVDYPVTYTQFAKREIEKIKPMPALEVIYHGSDPKTFYPIQGQARDVIRGALFPGMPKDCFLVLNVNRNQQRKDLNRTFAAFAKFHKKQPNSFLFVHAAVNDVGGNLVEIAEAHGLVAGKDWSYPDPSVFNPAQGVPIEVVNQIYAASDLVVSSTLGEGWGLSLTEAMACKKPVLFPRHTSIEEIIGENEERGTFVRCGGPDHTIALGQQDNGRVRPLVHIDDMADKMLNICRYPSKYQKKAEAAYQWVLDHTWENKAKAWKEVFARALGDDHEQP